MSNLLTNFLELFYPNVCPSCSEYNINTDWGICLSCQYKIAKTDFHKQPNDNAFKEKFIGRVPLEAATAIFYYEKGNRAQKLIYHLKYYGKPKLGERLGRAYGSLLIKQTAFQNIDIILPIPLHPKKLKIRGYNQSTAFAKGLSERMNCPYSDDILQKKTHTESQTRKDKFERFENVLEVFDIKQPQRLEGKHVLLVDDVITTGATLEACAIKIAAIPNTKVSMATIGYAIN